MGGRYEPEQVAWKQVGHEAARAVESQVIVPLDEGGRSEVAVTRIAPGGEYGTHVDDYSQVFCVVEGRGEGEVADERTPLAPGVMLKTAAGEPHALHAADDVALVVLVVNTYPAG